MFSFMIGPPLCPRLTACDLIGTDTYCSSWSTTWGCSGTLAVHMLQRCTHCQVCNVPVLSTGLC